MKLARFPVTFPSITTGTLHCGGPSGGRYSTVNVVSDIMSSFPMITHVTPVEYFIIIDFCFAFPCFGLISCHSGCAMVFLVQLFLVTFEVSTSLRSWFGLIREVCPFFPQVQQLPFLFA